MMVLQTIDDLLLLRETSDLECKKAAGVDGKGELPINERVWKRNQALDAMQSEGDYP